MNEKSLKNVREARKRDPDCVCPEYGFDIHWDGHEVFCTTTPTRSNSPSH